MVPANQSIVVKCAVCRGTGTYALPSYITAEQDLEMWAAVPCFFTPRCPGHVWPEASN